MRALDAFSLIWRLLPEWMLNSFLRTKKFSFTYLLFSPREGMGRDVYNLVFRDRSA